MAVPAQVDPPATAAPDELPRAAEPLRAHLVHQEIEPQHVATTWTPIGQREPERDRVAGAGWPPGTGHHGRGAAVARSRGHPETAGLIREHDQEPVDRAALVEPEIHLQTVRVDVIGIVV